MELKLKFNAEEICSYVSVLALDCGNLDEVSGLHRFRSIENIAKVLTKARTYSIAKGTIVETFSVQRHLSPYGDRHGTSPERSSWCRGDHYWFGGKLRCGDRDGGRPGTVAYPV